MESVHLPDRHDEPETVRPWGRRLALIQGTYYVVTGVWPLLDIGSFEKVTGPKTDRWLVKTVGALVGVLGGALTYAAARRKGPSKDLALAAAGSAAALAAVDVVYVARGRIARVYLLDALPEVVLALGWSLLFRRR